MNEIERKFLLNVDLDYLLAKTDTFGDEYDGKHGTYLGFNKITQHYLRNTGDWSIRVRKIEIGEELSVTEFNQTMKKRISDIERYEIEENINAERYEFISNDRSLSTEGLTKHRHFIEYKNFTWEIDQFTNPKYKNIIICEIELETVDQIFPMPFWVGEEVTSNKSYRNAYLARGLG